MSIRICAAMIVRDEAECLATCLASIRGVVDDIVIVDTGSRDDTPSIARRFTDQVYSFAWNDDFSAARNYGLARAKGDYALMIDADNWLLEPETARARLDDFTGCHDTAVVGSVAILSEIGVGGEAGVSLEHVQRFYPLARFRYEGIIHEQLMPVDGGAHRVAPTGLRYGHSGYRHAPGSPKHKAPRNIRLLKKAIEASPGDDYFLFQLGKAHFSMHEHAEAAVCFEQALARIRFEAGKPPVGKTGGIPAETLADLVSSLAYAYANTNRLGEARGLVERHLAMDHAGAGYADVPHALGYVCLMQGDVAAARAAYEQALARRERELVQGVGSYRSHYHLGLLAEASGQDIEALRHYAEALRDKPDYQQARDRCGEILARRQAHG